MTHRSFKRGFSVGRSANAALVAVAKGTGGLLGKNQRMPMPKPQTAAGTGAPIQRGTGAYRGLPGARQPVARGTGMLDCGCMAAMVEQAGHMPTCGGMAKGVVTSLTTTLGASTSLGVAANTGTVSVTAQVTSCNEFCVTGITLDDAIADDWLITAVNNPDGQNLLPNGTAVRGGSMSSKNEIPFALNGCCVRAALSITVNATNISNASASYFQATLFGVCR